eukprot:TRINITY_DN191_c5_g1_i1.p1 TRINITY_DN191_c5_g1~~TRINITY_DN191_c5_g1_i1.p1  ORF type:complete len:300 (+),score=51.95 TRINITY_DN191_c5_g1_i1:690-1589(+)
MSTELSSRIRVHANTFVGNRYGNLNQDTHFSHRFVVNDRICWLWGVCDGHGIYGEHASSLAKQMFIKEIQDVMITGDIPSKEDIEKIFIQIHENIIQSYSKLPKTYLKPDGYCFKYHGQDRLVEMGTTATIVIHIEGDDRLLVSNVGDSPAYLIGIDGDDLVLKQVNLDHNVKNNDEGFRLKSYSNCLISDEGYIQMKGTKSGVELQVSRALGHKEMFQCGIIPNPSYNIVKLTNDHLFLIIGSDGLFDNLDFSEITDVMVNYNDPKLAANELISLVQSLEQINDDIDNTTVVLIYFPE